MSDEPLVIMPENFEALVRDRRALHALRQHARALLDALPRCEWSDGDLYCDAIATRRYDWPHDLRELRCSKHGRDKHLRLLVTKIQHAAPAAALATLLDEMERT